MLPFVTHGLRLLLHPPLQVQTQPDLAIMAVNTFVKDSQDPNPLIRALAVRTMGCIRVDKITEYLCDPLHRCLKVGSQGVWGDSKGQWDGAGGTFSRGSGDGVA